MVTNAIDLNETTVLTLAVTTAEVHQSDNDNDNDNDNWDDDINVELSVINDNNGGNNSIDDFNVNATDDELAADAAYADYLLRAQAHYDAYPTSDFFSEVVYHFNNRPLAPGRTPANSIDV